MSYLIIILNSVILVSLVICDVPLLSFLFLLIMGVIFCFSVAITVNSWCAMLLFLIFVGGLLVLFMYINIIKISFFNLGVNMSVLPAVVMVIFFLLSFSSFHTLGGDWSKVFYSGEMFPASIILMLVCFLLFIFLVIVDIVSPKVGSMVIG